MEKEIEGLRASLEVLAARQRRTARWLGSACGVLLLGVGWLLLEAHDATVRCTSLEAGRIVLDRFGSIELQRDSDGQRSLAFGYSERHSAYGLFLDDPDGALSITLQGRPRIRLGTGARSAGGAREHELLLGDSPYVVSAVDPIGLQMLEHGIPRVAIGPFRGDPHVSLLDASGGQYLVDIRPQGRRGGLLSVHGLPEGEGRLAYPPRAVTVGGAPALELTNDAGEVVTRIE
jgi:hypothetical protein